MIPFVTVVDALAQREAAGAVVARPEFFGAIERVVGAPRQAAFAVAVFDQVALRIQNRGAQSGVDAVHPQAAIEQVVAVLERRRARGRR